ncbi:malto-oligosyltrehalose trehalohydrolase [Rhodocytophaga aerolata]|uniref:Malto-oligosyltrehalose trehalohydrolase n=1 Tax=Rhodocytophaga aerolata TaxID=455078 RepID=A0ABT8R194_9BACT|nr:malto-oligosyltrehalose trehalohydrolase [Rhodocytophaga aerolata]MDO1445867.1 malto-oligosyltrehalose trehalohydrolase [Rhodocytophaga aerolata]
MKIGANYQGNGRCTFTFWAPLVEKASVHIITPEEKLVTMQKQADGYFIAEATNVMPGTQYFYQIDGGKDRPDPATYFQPKGLHKASQVVDHQAYAWKDKEWKGIPLQDMIIYELHVGTFSPEGTFRGVLEKLDYLAELGINAIELLPISQFPGNRNWGYDGVHPYSVQNSYGTPDDFKALVDACHAKGIAVVLDMVYNHLGPEGNYVTEFGPYFIEKYHTPWGAALNFDEKYADPIRDFFADSAVYFLEHFHVDALRLDAIHAVFDMGAVHFWQYVNQKVAKFSARVGRPFYTIAESDLNDVKVIKPLDQGGWGFNSQWMDDFHHSLHALLTGEKTGYYTDFGSIQHLAKSFQEGFVYNGTYSDYRKRKYGNSSTDFSGEHFVIYTQNHDQVGNRMLGDRLTKTLSFDALKLAAAAMLLSPYVPMLFMGEEYAEDAPFLYFVSHSDPGLVEAVRNGRKAEFSAFSWMGEAPDPQAEQTFLESKLHWHKKDQGQGKLMLEWYKKLIALRKAHVALHNPDKKSIRAQVVSGKVIVLERWFENTENLVCLLNCSNEEVTVPFSAYEGTWHKILDASDKFWGGNGNLLPPIVKVTDQIKLQSYNVALFQKQS